MANSVGYHESESKLRPETLDNHRALTSMQEELEAVDWYDQRMDAATDQELKEILAHNRDSPCRRVDDWVRRGLPPVGRELAHEKERRRRPSWVPSALTLSIVTARASARSAV